MTARPNDKPRSRCDRRIPDSPLRHDNDATDSERPPRMGRFLGHWQARRWRCKILFGADHSSCEGIDPWLARPRWRGFFWDFAFHGRLLPTNRPRFHARQPQQIHQTVDRAIGYLQTESAAWLNTRKCAACHHVPMPLWALSEAERQGYAIDKKFVADTTESLLGSRDKLMASKIFPNPADPPDPRPQGRGLNMGLPFLAVAAQSLPSLKEGQKQSLKLIAEEIVKKQQPDGSWEFFATLRRPPINESQTTDAAWIIMALEGETGPDAPESQRAALSKAIAWLDAAKRSDIHQDKVLKVLHGGSLRQAARNDANHDRRVACTATRRRWLEPDRP